MSRYGYEHWTGKPLTPGKHELALVPQSIADGWQAFCSCGLWETFISMRGLTRDETLKLLREHHEHHLIVVGGAKTP